MHKFNFADESFADIQLLRYRLNGFEKLSLKQKIYIYYLSEAILSGRDITADQFGRYNLLVRKTLEMIVSWCSIEKHTTQFKELEIYLKRIWFSNGIYHHYSSEKIIPDFSEDFLRTCISNVSKKLLPIPPKLSLEKFTDLICKVIFNKDFLSQKTNLSEGVDLVTSSACNYYENVTQEEVEDFYKSLRDSSTSEISWGLNTKLLKDEKLGLKEETWKMNGLYGNAIKQIVINLQKALNYAENKQQEKVITLLIDYYKTGDLNVFNKYSIEWIKELEGSVDFINGFIEVYSDPLGLKGAWEGIVHYIDEKSTVRTQKICNSAQWFEDNSPIDDCYKKEQVKGVSARVVCAAMLAGDEYPASAIGINLPNAEWIRTEYGSKSITIGNLTEAYNKISIQNGFYEEFIEDKEILSLIPDFAHLYDDIHTDLHECLGHGSGKVLPNVGLEVLKAYGNTIEEARADLFALYYIADPKMIELGLLSDGKAYKVHYYLYLLNGLLTQSVRIELGKDIEEAHMRNRALISNWILEKSKGSIRLYQSGNKTYLRIDDYVSLRKLFAVLLKEIQRIKSEGDYEAAKLMVEKYGVKLNAQLHREIVDRYKSLNIAPYKGFINPVMVPIYNSNHQIIDIKLDYTESFSKQMLRYSEKYGFLI